MKDNPPSFEEVEAYARHRGFADPSGFAAYYLAVQAEAGWMTGKGSGRKPIDNWKLNVLAWEPNHKFREFSAPTPGPSPRRGKESLSENWSRTARELGIKIDEDYEQQ